MRVTKIPSVYLLLLIALAILTGGCGGAPKAPPAEKKAYAFWPAAPDEPRIQFLATFNNSQDLVQEQKSRFDQMIYGSEPKQTYEINKPYGVRMWNGRIYICDVRSKGITVLDLRKQQTRVMGATGVTSLGKAADLAIAPDGTKYVADNSQSAILVYSPEERFVSLFPLPGSSPVGVALFGDLLYVVDFKNSQVLVLDRHTGKQLRTIGQKSGEDGDFIGPLGIVTDKEGNIYVSDTLKARIQKFSPEGKFLLAFGETGGGPGNFIRPKQMGVGSDGSLHVVDAAFNNVQVFVPHTTPEGLPTMALMGYYGSYGSHPGAMDLPAGLDIHETDLDLFAKYVHPAFEAERLILVANQFGNQKISVYAMGHLKPGKTIADISPGRAKVEAGLEASTQPTSKPVGATTAPSQP